MSLQIRSIRSSNLCGACPIAPGVPYVNGARQNWPDFNSPPSPLLQELSWLSYNNLCLPVGLAGFVCATGVFVYVVGILAGKRSLLCACQWVYCMWWVRQCWRSLQISRTRFASTCLLVIKGSSEGMIYLGFYKFDRRHHQIWA